VLAEVGGVAVMGVLAVVTFERRWCVCVGDGGCMTVVGVGGGGGRRWWVLAVVGVGGGGWGGGDGRVGGGVCVGRWWVCWR